MSRKGSDVVELATVPELGALYRRAVTGAVRRRAGGGVPTDLPAAQHHAGGVRADLSALTRFQHLLGAAARDHLPSAYLHTLAFPVGMSVLARPDFPLPLLGMVHLGNEVHQVRPVGALETLDVVARSEDLRFHPAGTQFDLVTEIAVDGERAWSGRSIYLARGVRLAAPTDHPPVERPAFTPPVPTGVWHLDAGTGRRYAAVSGDWNPIHLSGPSARALGMKSAVAHGMYLAARMVDGAVPGPAGALSWGIDFATPVPLPGTVAMSFAARPTGRDSAVDGGSDSGAADRAAAVGTLVDVVGWDAKRRRPHFTGWVRTHEERSSRMSTAGTGPRASRSDEVQQ